MKTAVTRLRAELDNTTRGQRRDWTNPSQLTITGCVLAPRTATEDTTAGRQGVIIGWTLYAPADVDLVATDRIEHDGRLYEIDGHPANWVNPYTYARRGLEVALRAVEG